MGLNTQLIIIIVNIINQYHLKSKVESHDKRKRNRLKDALFVENMVHLFRLYNLAKHLRIILTKKVSK